jgi:hypothetical protein
VTNKVDSGIYIHEDIQIVRAHYRIHQKQQNLQKLTWKKQEDFCEYCYPHEDFSSSEVFDHFIKWAEKGNLPITSTTGKSVHYYIQIYRAFSATYYKKHDVQQLIRKLLKSFFYSEKRNLLQDTLTVYEFAKVSHKEVRKENSNNSSEDFTNILPSILTNPKAPTHPTGFTSKSKVPGQWEQQILNRLTEGNTEESEESEQSTASDPNNDKRTKKTKTKLLIPEITKRIKHKTLLTDILRLTP